MKLIIGPASQKLGEKIVSILNIETVGVSSKIFPDGECYVKLEGDVQDEDVYILQTTSPPQNIRLIQLGLIADAAKRCKAKNIIGIVPYLAYSRQDKVFLKGESLSIEAISKMLSAFGFNGLITVNIHQEKILDVFPFPAKNLSAISSLAKYFKNKHGQAFVLAPDKGAMYIAEEAKGILGGDCGYLEKYRDRYSGQIRVKKKDFKVKDKTVIIFDDIISTGGTIVSAAKILNELGAGAIYVACVHPLLIGDAEKRILQAGVNEIIGTDSVPNCFSKVSLASILSEELKSVF